MTLPGVTLYVALFTFFLTKFLFFERVHLCTYDFFARLRLQTRLGMPSLLSVFPMLSVFVDRPLPIRTRPQQF
jgi:hypothetical protein